VVLTGGFLSKRMATISKPMATIQERIANSRRLFAFPLLSLVGTKDLVVPSVVVDGTSLPSTLVIFFDVPLSGILFSPKINLIIF
jgi:hypothetical protein